MRVLHVTDTYAPTVGGIEVLVHDLAHLQAAAGHEVTVLTPTLAPAVDDGGSVRVVRGRRRARDLLRECDVVHAHVSVLSRVALHAAEDAAHAGVPVLVTVHSMWTDVWPAFRATAIARGWGGLPIQWAAVSTAAALPVQRAVRRPVLVLPNAVDTEVWVPRRDPGERPVTIVSVLRMARRKRPLQLVRALARMHRRLGPQIPVRTVLVGDGPLLDTVRRAVRTAGLDGVEVVGGLSHEELRELYRTADIFVAPAIRESFGIAALEARAAGLAVVARAGTGVAEFVTDGVDGCLARSDIDLADRLHHLCADPAALARIRRHTTAVAPGFGWSDVLWRNEDAYAAARRCGPTDDLVPAGTPGPSEGLAPADGSTVHAVAPASAHGRPGALVDDLP